MSAGSDCLDTTTNERMVSPIMYPAVRKLCLRPYYNHPHGCPNYGKRKICPPDAPILGEIINLNEPIYIVWNKFDLAGHVERMREKQPLWTDRQLYCCLYWQQTARKQLKERVFEAMKDSAPLFRPLLKATFCPEANGVNLTATMKRIGITLEWPPRNVAYQIALVGRKALEG